MVRNSIQNVLVEMWDDLKQPDMLWQGAAIFACLAIAWALSRLMRVRSSEEHSRAVRMGVGGINRVVFPRVVVLLLLAMRVLLARWTHVNMLSVAIPVFASLAGIRFVVYLLRLVFSPGGGLAVWERAIAAVIWIVVVLHLTGLLPEIEGFLDGFKLSIGKQKVSMLTVLESAFWILTTLLLALWAGSVLESRLMRAEVMHTSLRVVLARLGKALLLVISLLVVLAVMGIDLTVLSVFGGALGVGLGLGLQKIASNYFSGFIILLDRSIRLGDWITADNHYGEVKQITARYTVVRSQAGVEAIIPNDTLITSTVLNNTYADRKLRLTVKVSVAYATEVAPVLALLAEIAGRHARVLKDPAPNALILALADSGIDLELGFWIDDPQNGRGNVCSDISLAILTGFRSRQIEIPFPQRELRILPETAA
ncbi:MAG: mechanosensitive ion channel [Betaproteobacteria bacterium]|nr:mechanosensitive ion channel [Betaproteobacteria bacterium]